MQQALYSADLRTFLDADPEQILGKLVAGYGHELQLTQKMAWQEQVAILKKELAACKDGWIAFEFAIPRMGKRVDVIVIRKNVVFVIEFKVGKEDYAGAAVDQVKDYTLDLKNFHSTSHAAPLVPLLIATDAKPKKREYSWWEDKVAFPAHCSGEGLSELMAEFEQRAPDQTRIDGDTWAKGSYKPTPTIVDAAKALYAGHKVQDITRTKAGESDLEKTGKTLAEIIERSKKKRERSICFVTGVPGAGKTLAGLNLATSRTRVDEEEHAVFLSGNDPLVQVLCEALAQDEQKRARDKGKKASLEDCRRKVAPFIRNIRHFRDDYLRDKKAPAERVTIFDEAQRAWNAEHLSNFMKKKRGIANFSQSEPEFLIDVMNRHKDWCTVVCLVGGGQEINSGEAGLTEWFHALKTHFKDWKVYASPILDQVDYHWGTDLSAMLHELDHEIVDDLHLKVAIRSFRAEKLSAMVGAMIAGDAAKAKALFGEIKGHFPIFLTRDLNQAKTWLRSKARGSERFGLVSSSKALRLKAHGIHVKARIEPADWFLKPKSDVRSSYYLEDVATEFQIQGLELDWVGVCWEGNFRREGSAWKHFQFKGSDWMRINDPISQAYLANSYRVLLTRARQGMVIFVPEGDSRDSTRSAAFYDGTWAFLKACGLPELGM